MNHFWQRVWHQQKINYKNRNIQKNIRSFVASRTKKLPVRETVIKPEILIPCYNQAEYLNITISSLTTNIPITIIDDASRDIDKQIIDKLSEQYTFKLIRNKTNLNQAGSLNRAIETSTNNFFIIVNADDVLLPYSITTLTDLAKMHQQVFLFGSTGYLPFENESLTKFSKILPDTLDYEPDVKFIEPEETTHVTSMKTINMMMTSCAFFKSAWEYVDGFWTFNKRVCSYDDRDFQLRVASMFHIGLINEPLALYRLGSSTKKACI